jgi:ribonuclease HI
MPDSLPPIVAVYADESCLGNGLQGDNPGGAGGVVEVLSPRSGELVRRDYWVSEPATTNNRMALRSAIEAFRALSAKGQPCRVLFTSDSQYLVQGAQGWVHDWARRGWRRKGGPIENLTLWQELAEASAAHEVQWRWVRGHDGHPQNEYANVLATRAAAQQTSSGGLTPSGFDAWLAAERAHGRISLAPDPLPDPAAFRPCSPLPRTSAARLL